MIQLDTPTQSGPPAAYFPSPGDSIVVGIVNVTDYQQRDYDTGDLKTWPDGGKVMGKCITGLVVSTSGDTAKGTSKAHEPVSPGDLVTFWAEGGKHYTYRDAVKEAGSVNVGDVMQWKRENDEPASNSRYNDRKVYSARIRHPEPRDGDIVERCQAKYRELTEQRLETVAPAAEPAAANDPF
jgi:hypothetical protein